MVSEEQGGITGSPKPDVKLTTEEKFERGLACLIWLLSLIVFAAAVLFFMAAFSSLGSPAFAALYLVAGVIVAVVAFVGAAAGGYVWKVGLE